jgi:hypothetical protein
MWLLLPAHRSHAQLLDATLPTPSPTTDLKSALRCYTLPFGAINFASNLLTYHTVPLLGLSRSPAALPPALRHRL